MYTATCVSPAFGRTPQYRPASKYPKHIRSRGLTGMERLARTKSYYAASAHGAPDRAELESCIECDVCVVGGGIAGCSTSLHLAESGYDVLLLEEYRVGWGASGGTVRVRTPRGEVRTRYLVLCGNVYLKDTAPALAAKIIAVGSHIVATEPLGVERARSLIANNAAVCDMNWVLDYFRCSADHRLLFGGRVSSVLRSRNPANATRERMLRVFPQLAGARIEYPWGGHVDVTMNRAPNFGRLAPNIYFLQGFSGQGIALTGIAGKLVSQAIAGTAERFDVFARIPHRDFPGGAALRRPALALAMFYYGLRDLV
jgi:glycine/D-amino acid oxidase-like deaminating enzyme